MSQETPVAIFWDIDRLPLSSESPTYEILNEITDKAHEDGFVVLFKAYSDVPELANGGSTLYDLQSAGVSFIGCAQDGTKNVTISTDMLLYAMDHPAPATLIVISDDNQLIYVCSILRMRKYRVIVDTSSHAGHRIRRGASAFVNRTGLTGATSCDNYQELDSRSVQSDSSYETSTSNPLRGSHHEATNQVSYTKYATSSLRASSRKSELSAPRSRTFGSQRIDDIYQNNHRCCKYPACHCTRSHEAADVITDRELPSATETTMYRTRSLALPHRSPPGDNPPPIGPFAATSKPEESASITKDLIAMISLSDSNSPPSTKSLRACEIAAALTLPTERKAPTKTEGAAVEEARETETVLDTPKMPLLAVAPISPKSAFQADASATGVDMSPDDHANVSPLPPQPPVVFQALVDELQHQGVNLRLRSVIEDRLLKRDPIAYSRIGVSNIKEYIDQAVDAGIVAVSMVGYLDRPPDLVVSLVATWRLPQESVAPTQSSTSISRPPSPLKATNAAPQGRSLSQSSTSISRPPSPLEATNAAAQGRSLFQELVDELRQQPEGSHTDRGTAATGLLRRNPSAYTRAGVTSFKQFAAKAVAAGVVTLGNSKNRAGKVIHTIYLTPAWKHSTPVKPQPSSFIATQSSTCVSRPPLKATDTAPQDRSLFQGLIDELRQHGSHPERSEVMAGLLRKDSSAYTRAGVTSFKKFADKAVAAGVVTLGYSRTEAGNPIATIYLTPAWKHSTLAQPQPSALPDRATPWPNTTTAPDLSPFRNLVEELERWSIPRPNRIAIAADIGNRHPLTCATAGCANFDEYFALAMEAGIVSLGKTISPGRPITRWISLNQGTEPRQSVHLPAGVFSKKPPPIPKSFSPLVERLRKMRDNNITRPLRWRVHAALIYSKVSVGDFSEYAKNAEVAGFVRLGGEGQREWIALAVH
ncbi:hypothetical protein FIBSPDRAFT_1045959 [Athelia psychrophila]|uniref:NYN domain-containing protein n=1 Tax=Athelia psychrophila TaxID=1759441 RepID=A0A166HH03_9AGAM|nr:hypothetical protein FIBSPDRAFT_1045959 [Fibularhizoctonia sp. CBS 109695]